MANTICGHPGSFKTIRPLIDQLLVRLFVVSNCNEFCHFNSNLACVLYIHHASSVHRQTTDNGRVNIYTPSKCSLIRLVVGSSPLYSPAVLSSFWPCSSILHLSFKRLSNLLRHKTLTASYACDKNINTKFKLCVTETNRLRKGNAY